MTANTAMLLLFMLFINIMFKLLIHKSMRKKLFKDFVKLLIEKIVYNINIKKKITKNKYFLINYNISK